MSFIEIRNQFNIKRLNHSTWDVKFWGDNIITKVTNCGSEVDLWIQQTIYIHRNSLHKLVIGLDTEWCPKSEANGHQKVAIIQLCIERRCLIFQLYHATAIPRTLIDFLGNKKFIFVGKEVKNDARKLFEDYQLYVANVMDVSKMAASKYNDKELRRLGLAALVAEFLPVWMEKPKDVTMSEWDQKELSEKQIQYAAIDGFASYRLGVELMKPRPRISY